MRDVCKAIDGTKETEKAMIHIFPDTVRKKSKRSKMVADSKQT